VTWQGVVWLCVAVFGTGALSAAVACRWPWWEKPADGFETMMAGRLAAAFGYWLVLLIISALTSAMLFV